METDPQPVESRLDELEIRLTHQEVLLQDLNDIVARQQQALDRLRRDLGLLAEQVRAQARPDSAAQESPPPHY